MNALVCVWVGGILFLAGFLYRQEKIGQIDGQVFLAGHLFLREKIGAALFQRLWFLGRTPFTLLWLSLLIMLNWRYGLIAGGIYVLAAGLEGGGKLLVGRPRPWGVVFPEGVDMLQPQRPTDSSFPSGDSFRVWFLALILPAFWGAPWYVYTLSVGAALTVTLGRVAMGVHYPLDTISGTGLGFLSAGLTVLAWQAVGFL